LEEKCQVSKLMIAISDCASFKAVSISVIADSYVDKEFGTGALKITPAHDANDYELSLRHKLPAINMMNKDATINEAGGVFSGLSREECRLKLWERLVCSGHGVRTQAHTQRVPRSQRGGAIIEPRLSEQWFVRTKGLATKALEAVNRGHIKLVPQRFEAEWSNWLGEIHDWCVSRQLWWGHRIPVYYVSGDRDRYVVVSWTSAPDFDC
jgi:valyl-tRNA synthetase